LALTDYHLIGNQGNEPCLDRGPYELTFLHDGRDVGTKKVDPTQSTHMRVTITEPDRSLYVYAGEDQRLTTGDVAKLRASVVVVGDEAAKTIVQLDGSRSTDPRGFPPHTIRYQWRQTGGPTVNLSSVEWIDPIFFPDQPGNYEFELVVSSPIAASEATRYIVEVTKAD